MVRLAPSPAPRVAGPGRLAGATLDLVGSAVSVACAAHCLALPVAVALLPALALHHLLHPAVEWGFLAATVLVGGWSLGPVAWQRRRAGPLLLLLAGVAALAARRVGGDAAEGSVREQVLVAAGATLVLAAHVANWRQRRRAG